MTLLNLHQSTPLVDGRQSERALAIRRGLQRLYFDERHATLPELSLSSGRRADLVTLSPKGFITIIEIKSSVEDFRVDTKWHEYKDFCDVFYFATHSEVPQDIFPKTEGLIIADRYGAEIVREASHEKLAASTRKTVTQRFAVTSAERLLQAEWQATGDGEI